MNNVRKQEVKPRKSVGRIFDCFQTQSHSHVRRPELNCAQVDFAIVSTAASQTLFSSACDSTHPPAEFVDVNFAAKQLREITASTLRSGDEWPLTVFAAVRNQTSAFVHRSRRIRSVADFSGSTEPCYAQSCLRAEQRATVPQQRFAKFRQIRCVRAVRRFGSEPEVIRLSFRPPAAHRVRSKRQKVHHEERNADQCPPAGGISDCDRRRRQS